MISRPRTLLFLPAMIALDLEVAFFRSLLSPLALVPSIIYASPLSCFCFMKGNRTLEQIRLEASVGLE
jgi:hypothetical protein